MMLPRESNLSVAAPLLADGLALLALVLLLPGLSEQMSRPSGLNALLLGVAYVIFCLSVYALRKLQPPPLRPQQPPQLPPLVRLAPGPKARGVLGVFFGLVLMTALAQQLGYFDLVMVTDPMALGEGEAAAFFVFAPGAWLGVSLMYTLVLAFPVKPAVAPASAGYGWVALAGLLGTNGLLLLATAQMQAVATGLSLARPLLLPLVFLLFLLLFAPPRLLYLARHPHWSAALTFLALVGYCVTRL